MKKIFFFMAAAAVSIVSVQAQDSDPELDYIKKAYSKDKKIIVEEYMKLDVQEGAKFWSVYGEYESGREKLAKERLALVDEYVNNALNLTDPIADKLAKGVLANNSAIDKLNSNTYKKMKKAVGAVQAAKFIQLEYYLQTTWRSALQDLLPLIGDLDDANQNN